MELVHVSLLTLKTGGGSYIFGKFVYPCYIAHIMLSFALLSTYTAFICGLSIDAASNSRLIWHRMGERPATDKKKIMCGAGNQVFFPI
jgi:hypothetical protein